MQSLSSYTLSKPGFRVHLRMLPLIKYQIPVWSDPSLNALVVHHSTAHKTPFLSLVVQNEAYRYTQFLELIRLQLDMSLLKLEH